jgi:hypothetical protein
MTAAATGRSRRARHPPAYVNRVVLAMLRSPLHRLLDPGMCELRYRGRRSGRSVSLPVMYAAGDNRTVVLVGDAPDKRWWRNFTTPAPVDVRRAGRTCHGTGRIVPADHPDFPAAWAIYEARHHIERQDGDRLLIIDHAPAAP